MLSIDLNMNKSIEQTEVTSRIGIPISSFLVVPFVLIVNISFHSVALSRDETKVVECQFYILSLFTYLRFTEPILWATRTVFNLML
jgi:hypothetical protein